MNKWYHMLLAAFLSLGVLAGCQAESGSSQGENSEQTEQQEIPVEITVSQNNGEEIIEEKELEVEQGQNLMEVLKNNFDDVEEKDGFINSIEGIQAKDGEQKAWFYTINGEDATVGANEYEVEENDQITFDFHAWE